MVGNLFISNFNLAFSSIVEGHILTSRSTSIAKGLGTWAMCLAMKPY